MDSTSKINKPFFIYWAPNLCHQPFSPTPDDPDFAIWDPQKKPQERDTIYFKSMVNYYDKDIGKLLTKLKESNLEKNTLILFLIGDNGTEDIIKSKFEDHYVAGGKGHTYLTGIHISLIAYWAGKILPARDGNIVDFVDFLPTIADVAKINLSTTYGTLDGISFYDQLLGYAINKRQYSYEWYDVNRFGPDNIPPTSWALDKDYKVYNGDSDLINYTTDPFERNPITYFNQTSDQKSEHAILENVIKSYH
jgi:arylsulfatase A